MRRCKTADCEQMAECEMVPGTKRIEEKRTKKGELIRVRGAADYRSKDLCYLCGKREAGLLK